MDEEFKDPDSPEPLQIHGRNARRIVKGLVATIALTLWLMFVWLTTISVPATNKLLDGRKKTAPIPISLMFENNWLIVPGLLLVASFLCLLVQRKWMAYACFLVFPVLASTIVIIALLFAIQGLNRTIWHVLRGES